MKDVLRQHVDSIIDKVSDIYAIGDEEKIVGRVMMLTSKVNDNDIDAMIELALMIIAEESKK